VGLRGHWLATLLAATAAACGSPQPAAQSRGAPAPVQQIAISVSPATSSVASGGSQQLAAAVSGTSDASVTWSADRGTVDQSGVFTAPGAAGTCHVTAASAADPTRVMTAVVTVLPPSISVGAKKMTVPAGGTGQFTATVTNAQDTRISWSVLEGSEGGSIDPAGNYVAPAAAGVFHAIAASVADPRETDASEVTVTEAPVSVPGAIVSVSIAPAANTLQVGATAQLTATVTGSSNTRVVWSTDGGGVGDDGLYTAPQTAGVFHVTAQSVADPSKIAIATLTVVAPVPLLPPVDPPQVTVEVHGLVAFQAHLPGTPDGQVNWSIQEGSAGGTIDALGRYIAPSDHEGIYHVVATSPADPAVTGMATVTVRFFDLIDSGGNVMPATRTFALWWGDMSAFPPDAQPNLEALLAGLNGSAYLGVLDQYLRGGHATTVFGGSLFDQSAPPSADPLQGAIADEACRALDAKGIVPAPGDMVFVFGSAFPAGNVSYCSWHSWGSCNGQSLLIAYLPNPAGTPCAQVLNGCSAASPLAAGVAGYAGHELIEAIVNPFDGAWKDEHGEEVVDKCQGLEVCVPLATATVMLTPLYSNAVHACVQQ
jgi:hypothetical protein